MCGGCRCIQCVDDVYVPIIYLYLTSSTAAADADASAADDELYSLLI